MSGALSHGSSGQGLTLPIDTAPFQTAQKESKKTTKELNQTAKASKSVGQSWVDIAKKVTIFGAVTSGIRMAKDSVILMAQEQLKLNKAQTEFLKVSNMTNKEMDAYTERAYKAGKATARTGTEMVDASTEFKKMGYTAQESLKLATVSTMFQNISDVAIDSADSAKLINGVLKAGFSEISGSADEMAMQVIDAYNEVANKNAVGTNDIAMAMKVSGTSLKTFGNTFQEALGMVTAGTEIMTGSPAKVARGLRSLSVNIGKMAQSSKTMQVQVNGATKEIDLYDKKTGDLRSTFDILNDVVGKNGKNWENMTKAEQTSFATMLGGKTQIDVLTAILGNWDTAIKATNDALNSQGSASKENEAFLKSLEGSLQALRSEWEQFATSTATKDLVNVIIKGATLGLKALNTTIGQFSIKTFAILGIIKLVSKLIGKIHGNVGKVTTKILKNVAGIETETTALKRNSTEWRKNNKVRNALMPSGADRRNRPIPNTTPAVSKADKGAKVTKIASGFSSQLSLIAKSMGVVLGGFALISGAIYLATKATDKFHNRWQDSNDELNKQYDEINDIGNEIQALEDKGKQRTKEEEATLQKLKEQKKLLEEQREINVNEALNKITSGDKNDGVYSTTQAKKDQENLEKVRDDWEELQDLRKRASQDKEDIWLNQAYVEKAKEHTSELKYQLSELEDQKQLMDDYVASGGKLTEDQKRKYAYLERITKEYKRQLNIIEALDKYSSKKTGISEEYVQGQSGSKKGRKKLEELSSNIEKAMSGGKGSAEAFNNILQQTSDNFVILDEKTNKYKLDGTKSLEEIANASHLTKEQLEELLALHGEEVEWEFSDEQIKTAMQTIKDFDYFVNETTGKTTFYSTQVQQLAETMGISFEQASALIRQSGYEILNLNGNAEQVVSTITEVGNAFGISVDKLGNITNIDFSSLMTGLQEAGLSVEEIASVIQELSTKTEGTDIFGGMRLSGEEAQRVVEYLNETIANTPDTTISNIILNDDGTISLINSKLDKTKEKEDVVDSSDPNVNVTESGSESAKSKLDSTKTSADNLDGADPKVTVSLFGSVKASFTSAMAKLNDFIDKHNKMRGHAKGKRKGEKGGLSWVGEEGAELIQTKDGAYLAGTQGWELVNLDRDDIVYTATETKKMLNKNNKQQSIGWKPRFARGRKYLSSSKRSKRKAERLDDYVDSLKYLLDMDRISESTYYSRLEKKIRPNRSSTRDQYKRYSREIAQGRHKRIKESRLDTAQELINRAGLYRETSKGESTYIHAKKYIQELERLNRISKEEEKELLDDLYHTRLDYFQIEYEQGKKTYSSLQNIYKQYYKDGKITYSEYLEYRNKLAEEQTQKEIDRLNDLQEVETKKQDLAQMYIDKQISIIDKQIESKEKEYENQLKDNEALEQHNNLLEAEINLAKAQDKQVKVFRKGQGFVYEADINELQQAQNDYLNAKKDYDDWVHSQEIQKLEDEKQKWQDILNMMDERQSEADIKELENSLGISMKDLFGKLGNDVGLWNKWFSDTTTTQMALNELINKLQIASEKGYLDINKLIGSDGKINTSYIEQALSHNKFVNGTLSAKGGMSLVGEKGAELRILNKGDGIIPSSLTKNLMQWGQISPTQWQRKTQIKSYNNSDSPTIVEQHFDKIILPNVINGNDFIRDMAQLKNKAIQTYRMR